jgi:predicted RNA-binding protein with PIN domain
VALIRILVDGYSLLHQWPELAPGASRFSAAARDALVRKLTEYRDATHTPITIFFDGASAPPGTPKAESSPEVEVVFSKAGQTADSLIERVAFRMRPYGEVLVVTDDIAERDTVMNFGGLASSCLSFVQQVEAAVGEMSADVAAYNRRERERFRRRGGG